MSTLPDWVALIGAICTTLLGALGAYLVGRRRNSGTVETSEAAQLWEASEQMRHELRDEVVELRETVRKLRVEAESCHGALTEARVEARRAKEESRQAKAEAANLSEEVVRLREQLVLAKTELEDIHRKWVESQHE